MRDRPVTAFLLALLLILALSGTADAKMEGTEAPLPDPEPADPAATAPLPPAPGDLREEWRYEYNDFPFRLVFGSTASVGDSGFDATTALGEAPEDLEVMTGNDTTIYDPDDPGCLGLWRLFDSRGNLEWATCTRSDEPGSSPFFTDIDADCEYEFGGGTTSGSNMQALETDGRLKWYWPSDLRDAFFWSEYWHPSAAVADVDPMLDGREIIAARYDGFVRLLRAAGGQLVWEKQIATGDPGCFGVECELFINSSPAVGDLDGNGSLEIVIGTNNESIVSLDWEGGVRWRFFAQDLVMSSAALADFDDDGDLEIVIGSDDWNVYFIDGDENGNRAIDADEVITFTTGGEVRSSPAVGDVDGDGDLEVLVASMDGHLYSFDYDPTVPTVAQNWRTKIGGASLSSPALADRTGNGTLEAYVGSDDHYLYLLNGTDGTILDSLDLGKILRASPVVADLDGDRRLEIVIMGMSQMDTLFVVEDAGSFVEPRTIEWGRFRQNDANTGLYGTPYPLLDRSCYNYPPTCNAGGPYTEECAGPETSVTLDGSGSSDEENDPLTFTWEGPFLESPAQGEVVTVTFPGRGTFDVTLTVDDGHNPPVPCETTVTIEDTTPPAVEPGSGDLACLWPPNHWYVCLQTADLAPRVEDLCCEPARWRFEGCRSDQPDEAPDPAWPDWNGDGNTTGDCLIRGDGRYVCMRSERAGAGPTAQDGRRYELSIVAWDECGNLSEPVVIGNVHVPHDQSPQERPCLDPTEVGLKKHDPLP